MIKVLQQNVRKLNPAMYKINLMAKLVLYQKYKKNL